MKLGIIGSGVIVQEFLPKLVKIEGIEILGIQGIKEAIDQIRSLCSSQNISCATWDFEELCATGIDTVYVAVPNFLHFDYCKRALEKGLNVIVEKPMASNYKEAAFLADLAKEKKAFLFEAITTVHLNNYRKIQEWLPRIGDIKIVQSQYNKISSRYADFSSGTILPAFDPAKSGGALMDLNLYNIHFVMGLFGKPDSCKYYANVERGIDTSGVLMLNYPSFVAVCISAKDTKGMRSSLIQGTLGCIKTSYPPNVLGEITLELNDGTIETFNEDDVHERLIPEFTTFINAINSNDYDLCYRFLNQSLDVCDIQTQARMGAGIQFPADQREL